MSCSRSHPRLDVSIILTAALLAIACAASLRAQVPMHVFQGGTTLESYGRDVCGAGDVNGDGYADIAISAPDDDGPGPGRVEIRSGRDGSLLHELLGATPGGKYGAHIAPLADLDGDGQQELIVASGNRKVVDVLSGAAFATIHHFQLPPGPAMMGWGLADLGDLDGDGKHDFSIAGNEGNAVGFVAIISGATGAQLLLKLGSTSGDLFGENVAAAGDVNGDGHPDFLVMHNEADLYFQGKVSFFSGKDGSELAELGGGAIGTSMGGVGDLDGDGCDEVILGGPEFLNPHFHGPGFAVVYSWKKNATLFEFTGEHDGSEMGYRSGGLGDVNGDGIADVFVTSRRYVSAPGTGFGKAYVYSGADGALLFSVVANGIDGFGSSAAAAGDVNGDGRCDLVVGTSAEGVLGQTGQDGYAAVHVISPPFLWLGHELAGTGPAPIFSGTGSLQPSATTTLELDGALPGGSAVLVAGLDALYAPFKGGTLVPDPDVILPGLPIDPSGHALLTFHWPAGMPAGTSVYLHMWRADPAGPWGFAASNALQAVTP